MAEIDPHAARRQSCNDIDEEIKKLRAEILKLQTIDKGDAHHLSNASRDRHIFASPCRLLERRVLKGHFGKVYCFAWSSDCERIASAAQDGKLIIWNAKNSTKIRSASLRCAWVMTCAYSPNRRFVAFGGLDNKCTFYNVSDLNSWRGCCTDVNVTITGARSRARSALDPVPIEAQLVAHQGYLSCCRFIDNEKVLTASGDTTCILWDIETETPRRRFTEHVGDVMSVTIFGEGQSGNIFVTGSCDNTSKVFDFRTHGSVSSMTFDVHQSDVNWVECLPNRDNAGGSGGGGSAGGSECRTFASASDDSTCRIYDLRCQRELNTYTAEHMVCGATSISFSKSGRYLFAGYDDTRCVAWDTLAGEIAQSIDDGHRNRISCVQVSNDGLALCTGSWDSTLKLWA